MTVTDPSRRRLLAGSLAAAMTLGARIPAAAQQPWSPTTLDTGIDEATALQRMRGLGLQRAELGYLYSVPPFLHLRQRYLWLLGMTRSAGGDTDDPFGQFLLLRYPTSPQTTDPSPNNDTLYGASFVDLSSGPVVLSVPDVPDRYYSVAMLDAYFYNFAYVGSRTTGQLAGRYLITGPGWQQPVPADITQHIAAPTNSINLYQRIYFKNAADLPVVRKLQDLIRIESLARYIDPKAAPARPDLAPMLAANPLEVRDPTRMFELANGYMGKNPPPDSDRALCEYFAPMGIGPGLAIPRDDADLTLLRLGAEAGGRTLAALAVAGMKIVDGWQMPPADVGRRGGAGGTVQQALTQVRTIGANVPEEAVYYTSYTDGAGHVLDARKRYALRFPRGGLPPVRTDRFGFWSLTMMHRDNYLLVANPVDRYALRSADPFAFDADGSLTLLLQTEAPSDPARYANWLPAPARGEFTLNLRVYVPAAPVLEGHWAPPPISLST
jgi:hypothetical protein